MGKSGATGQRDLIEVWLLGICTGIKGQYVSALRCIVERTLISGEFDPIRATGVPPSVQRLRAGSRSVEFENSLEAVCLTYIEIPGRTESYRFGIRIVRSSKGSNQKPRGIELRDLLCIKVGNVEIPGRIKDGTCGERCAVVVSFCVIMVPVCVNSVTFPLPVDTITVPVAMSAAEAFGAPSAAANANGRASRSFGSQHRSKAAGMFLVKDPVFMVILP
jgi:hypothetical protein